jgi:transglutaminase-like putative cysteine protease
LLKLNKEKYLQPTYLCESDSTEIINLAEKLSKGKSKREAVRNIFKWVRDSIPYKIEKVKSARELVKQKSRSGMCVSKVSLFISLCRAIKIPARYAIVRCLLKLRKNSLRVWHVIAEVFIEGEWVPADPSFGKHTKHIIPPTKFGKVEKNTKIMWRVSGLSRGMVFFVNLFYKFSPTIRRLKKLLES